MYVPKHFEETHVDVLHELIRAHPFGALVTLTSSGLEANHIPMVLAQDPRPYGTIRGHIARANPLWSEFKPDVEALALFEGPHAYISPSWYPTKKQTGKVVPTWNYAVVHAYGYLEIKEDPAWLRAHLENLTDGHEHAREESWQVADAPPEFTDKLVSAIVGLELQVTRIVGKWKVSQNRPVSDQGGVVHHLLEENTANSVAMATLVRERSGDRNSS